MSLSRAEILNKIKGAKQTSKSLSNTLGEAAPRLKDHPLNLVPQRGQGNKDQLIDQFQSEAERVNATVAKVSSEAEIPQEIAKYLADNNLPTRVKQAPALDYLDWSGTLVEANSGGGDATDEVCVTPAFAGVAETGTLVTYSGADTPTTLNFLPPVHVVVLKATDVSGSYEDVWGQLREVIDAQGQGNNFIPRTVNMITGPSRTGDIQQTLLLGIHGPQRLHIVIVDDKAAS